jgi:phosphoribosylformimino-5-aminoimidazole carboxamide ribotide isomerase
MKIIPAIDLLDGQVVRLFKGDYDEKKIYNQNPLDQAKLFAESGFDLIHVVDLNGAKSGRFDNLPHLLEMIQKLDVSIQAGGGIRSFRDVEKLLEAGISKVICSSMAVRKPGEWIRALQEYPDQCILGMDLKDGKMAYGGWKKTSDQALNDFLQPMIEAGRMLKRRIDNILTFTQHGITNAVSESLNAKIQWVKYTARGFRNKQNFIDAIYFHCGALDLAP